MREDSRSFVLADAARIGWHAALAAVPTFAVFVWAILSKNDWSILDPTLTLGRFVLLSVLLLPAVLTGAAHIAIALGAFTAFATGERLPSMRSALLSAVLAGGVATALVAAVATITPDANQRYRTAFLVINQSALTNLGRASSAASLLVRGIGETSTADLSDEAADQLAADPQSRAARQIALVRHQRFSFPAGIVIAALLGAALGRVFVRRLRPVDLVLGVTVLALTQSGFGESFLLFRNTPPAMLAPWIAAWIPTAGLLLLFVLALGLTRTAIPTGVRDERVPHLSLVPIEVVATAGVALAAGSHFAVALEVHRWSLILGVVLPAALCVFASVGWLFRTDRTWTPIGARRTTQAVFGAAVVALLAGWLLPTGRVSSRGSILVRGPAAHTRDWAVTGLQGVLRDPNPEVRSMALAALLDPQLDLSVADEELTLLLRSTTSLDLVRAAGTASAHADAVVAGLVALQASNVRYIACAAADSLVSLGRSSSVDAALFVRNFLAFDWSCRIETLAAIRDRARAEFPQIQAALRKSSPKDWSAPSLSAALWITGATDDAMVRRVADHAFSADARRSAAVSALGFFGEAARPYLPRLRDLLDSRDPGLFVLHETIIGALVRIDPVAALPLLNNPGFSGPTADAFAKLSDVTPEQMEQWRAFALDGSRSPLARVRALVGIAGHRSLSADEGRSAAPALTSRDRSAVAAAAVALRKADLTQVDVAALRSALSERDETACLVASALWSADQSRETIVAIAGTFGKSRLMTNQCDSLDVLARMGTPVAATIRNLFLAESPRTANDLAYLRATAVLAPIGDDLVVTLIEKGRQNTPWFRFAMHFLTGDRANVQTLLRWLPGGEEDNTLPVDHDVAIAALRSFQDTWRAAAKSSAVLAMYEEQVPKIVRRATWYPSDSQLLDWFASKLESDGVPGAAAVREAIASTGMNAYVRTALWVVAGQVLLWILLLALYPHAPLVQAFFFWTPGVRKYLGFGYVGALLPRVPPIRRRLLAPFREPLIDESNLRALSDEAYFADAEVIVQRTKQLMRLVDAIPRIDGPTMLVGASGYGKTMFLRHLLSESTRPSVFLNAEQCREGVGHAIAKKMGGFAGDEGFLESLIYCGGLDVYIDGLNEVSPDTRAVIKAFMQANPRSAIIITTQPTHWLPPTWTCVFELQPLSPAKIEAFLRSRPAAPGDVIDGDAPEFAERLATLLASWSHPDRSDWERRWAELVFGNPLDLTVMARLLRLAQQPDIWQLQEQQFALVRADYAEVTAGHEFPLAAISEAAYEMKASGGFESPFAGIAEAALQVMERHHLVTHRRSNDQKIWWRFRHERISDWFVAQTFMGHGNARPATHMGDDRFRGVYFLLATKMPRGEAARLREQLVERAAETRDHTISDEFVRLFRLRAPAGIEPVWSSDATT